MKAERRHELKENDLAHMLDVGRAYIDVHGRRIGIAIVIVVAVLAVTALTVRSQTAATEDRWRRKSELRFDDPEVGQASLASLSAMVKESTEDDFILTGLLQEGQQALRLAVEVPDAPDRELNAAARTAYRELLARFPENPLAVGAANLGLATVAENEFVIDRDRAHKEAARRALQTVIDHPLLDAMPFKRIAMDRLAELDETFTPVSFDEAPVEDVAPTAEPADPADAGP